MMAGLLDNPAFSYFAFYATVVVLKMLAMSPMTGLFRLKAQAFANLEDVKFVRKRGGMALQPATSSEVERIRRCHLNDLENVIPFVLIGLLYIATGPSLGSAILHFRIFAGARFFHTIAYLLPLPQPSRALGHYTGLCTTVSMAISVLSAAKM